MTRFKWQNWMLREMQAHYHNTCNEDLADLFGCSSRSVRRKAKEMMLHKSDDFMQLKRIQGLCYGREVQRRAGWPHKITEANRCKRPKVTRAKRVICLESGEVYESARGAARAQGISYSSLHKAIINNTQCNGKHWQYLSTYNYIKKRREEERVLWSR